jgi:hypothetical protein
VKIETLEPAFVESAPDQLEEGVLYVSTTYASAMHLCCCGCGTEVITPLSPARWSITFDGETISLWPSVGNWSQPCRSHYIIRKEPGDRLPLLVRTTHRQGTTGRSPSDRRTSPGAGSQSGPITVPKTHQLAALEQVAHVLPVLS